MQLCVSCGSIRSTRITTRRERTEEVMAGGRGGTGSWLGGRGEVRPGAESGRRGSNRQWRGQEEGGQCGGMDGIGKGWDRASLLLRHALCEHRSMRRRQNRQRSWKLEDHAACKLNTFCFTERNRLQAQRAGGEPSPRWQFRNWCERLD